MRPREEAGLLKGFRPRAAVITLALKEDTQGPEWRLAEEVGIPVRTWVTAQGGEGWREAALGMEPMRAAGGGQLDAG